MNSRSRFGVLRKRTGGNYFVWSLKCPRSYFEALETLISLLAEVAGVTFSDSDSAPFLKFPVSVPDPAPEILQIWESDSRLDSGCNHRSNHNLPMFLPKKWPQRLLLLPKWKNNTGSGSGFSQSFYTGSWSGSERKTQNSDGVDSGTPDPVPSLPTSLRGRGVMA